MQTTYEELLHSTLGATFAFDSDVSGLSESPDIFECGRLQPGKLFAAFSLRHQLNAIAPTLAAAFGSAFDAFHHIQTEEKWLLAVNELILRHFCAICPLMQLYCTLVDNSSPPATLGREFM